MTRYIFIVGGVMSGIGKGICSASLGRTLKDRGFSVSAVKIDPYVNVDAGTMNPIEHGEVFVTADGMECDQDIGTYERFLNTDIPGINSITTGQIYKEVITRERALLYDGKCVEVVPDIPNEVIRRLKNSAKQTHADILLVEIGGTAGEYQNILFLEAARLMRHQAPHNVAVVLVSYLPIPHALREMKTKPTQQAVQALQAAGLQPDFIVGRAAKPIDEPRKRKLSLFANVAAEHIISAPNAWTVYAVPQQFEKERFPEKILARFKLPKRKRTNLSRVQWKQMLQKAQGAKRQIRIGIAGKYFASGSFVLEDVYISVIEAIKHAAWAGGLDPIIQWLNTEEYEKNGNRLRELATFHGLIVPGGFGSRGVEGKIAAIRFARTHTIPYLGLCFGMQLAVVEFARNVAGFKDAHTTEIQPKTKNPVIDLIPEQLSLLREKRLGGSMRLGNYECTIVPRTKAGRAYSRTDKTQERHRHRFEFNNEFKERLEKKGLICSGINIKRGLVEIVELSDHPFFVGTQFHPELRSRPLDPHPLFTAFLNAAKKRHV